jgi:hypothetical protein
VKNVDISIYLITLMISDVSDISVPTTETVIASAAPNAEPLARGLFG